MVNSLRLKCGYSAAQINLLQRQAYPRARSSVDPAVLGIYLILRYRRIRLFVELSWPSAGSVCALEFRDDALRQHLAEFHAPLVERIDLPDGALGEHGMFVKSDELAESLRREPVGEDGVRRAVALEDAVRHEPVRRALGFDLLRRLSERQRFGLGEDVGQQHVVVAAERIERLRKGDEVARDEPRSLMDQLIEGVLAVGSRLAPIDRAGRVGDLGPVDA